MAAEREFGRPTGIALDWARRTGARFDNGMEGRFLTYDINAEEVF